MTHNKEYLLNESKNFCILPFIHMYLNTDGTAIPCCTAQYDLVLGNVRQNTIKEIWNGEPYKELRRKIINDQPVSNCQTCYLHQAESTTNNSFRQWANRDFAHHIDVIDTMNPDGSMNDMPLKYFDIRFSNVCNYKCRTCGDLFSTSWALEDKKFMPDKPGLGSIHVSNNDPSLLEQFKPFLPSMETIYFAGGEPLITPEHYEILEFLIDQKSTNMLLRYNSNMSVLKYKDKNVIDLWNQFEKVEMYASLDSWGERSEYIRHGSNWSEVVSNLKRIKKEAPHVKIQFNAVISIFNILTITDFLDELIKEDLFDVYESFPTLYRAVSPAELCVRVLDEKTKKIAIDKIINWLSKYSPIPYHIDYTLRDLITFLKEDHSHRAKESKLSIDSIDCRRNESFIKTFPELKDWYDSI